MFFTMTMTLILTLIMYKHDHDLNHYLYHEYDREIDRDLTATYSKTPGLDLEHFLDRMFCLKIPLHNLDGMCP